MLTIIFILNMLNQVRELRETVSRLEGSVLALSSTVQSLTESLVAGTLSQQSQGQQNSLKEDVPPAQDAFALLAEVRRALTFFFFSFFFLSLFTCGD